MKCVTCSCRKSIISRTFLIVFKALVVNLTRIKSPIMSDCSRLCWILGSQVRRVLCFEKGTLFPYCFILPWNKPCWDRLKGWDTTSHNALLGNIGDGGNGYQCVCRRQTLYLCVFAISLWLSPMIARSHSVVPYYSVSHFRRDANIWVLPALSADLWNAHSLNLS